MFKHTRREDSEQGWLSSALCPGVCLQESLSGCWRAQQLSGKRPFALSPLAVKLLLPPLEPLSLSTPSECSAKASGLHEMVEEGDFCG